MNKGFQIVGIGASAGGVEALEQFFRAMTPQTIDMAFVIVMHLDPSAHSLLPNLIARWTSMPVSAIGDGQQIEPQHVYVLPPDALATVKDGQLHLRKPSRMQRERTPIDILFNSLAEDQGENAVGIVLSGAGTDGALGIKAIKEHGGFTIAQGSNSSGPGFKDMPQSAIATGVVDVVVPVEHIPEWLSRLTRLPAPTIEEKNADELEPIFAILRDRVGHDFSYYKTRTFLRRVHRRMQVKQLHELADYVELLRKDNEEAALLFRDLLIGVTEFFRNPEAFAALQEQVVPKLFEHKGADDEVRVWVVGCATGEEAYSIAILLREYVDQHYKNAAPPKVTIFASDIDQNAMRVARAGRYPAAVLKSITPERLGRFFILEDGEYRVTRDLRDMCVFTDHSLTRDPPFSRLDLLSCRNLLIYMKTELQKQIFPIFHYALRPHGFLFLGVSESILRHNDLFVALDKAHRIFQRRELITPVTIPMPQFARGGAGAAARARAQPEKATQAGALRIAANLVSDRYSPAYVIVNDRWEVLHSSARTGKYLEAPVGPPSRDLFAWARREIRFDLRDALRKALETGRAVTREHIPLEVGGGVQTVKLVVEPIRNAEETAFAIVFIDVGPVRARGQETEERGTRAEQEGSIEQLEAELQGTRERLQATIEELETANEELKSSNEELLSVNEELQSTNEEMETSKEEIQSVNEELQTVNQALNQKIEELDRSNADLQNLFESTQVAVVFLDKNLVVRSFTPPVREIFNLIPSDRGRPLADIVNRLDDQSLEHLIAECMEKTQAIERRISARGGTTHYLTRVVPYRTGGAASDGVVAVFINITDIVAAEERQKTLARELNQVFRSTMEAVSSIASETAVHAASVKSFIEVFISRLAALSFTHELLSTIDWPNVPLSKLIEAELDIHRERDGKQIKLEGSAAWLTPHCALTLGIVFHELASDAARYGALSVAGGTVEVRWSVRGSGNARQLEIIWSETGGPPRGADPQRAFGFELIQRTMLLELDARAEIEFAESGLRCTISIPANEKTVSTAAPPAAV